MHEIGQHASNSSHEANIYVFLTGSEPGTLSPGKLVGQAGDYGTVCDSTREHRTVVAKYAAGNVKGKETYTAEVTNL